uniref:Uncharacterized protein n=1 Tax=Arundo donax TaxID=35708 RepID=A0A0A8XR01_ARUDO
MLKVVKLLSESMYNDIITQYQPRL